MNDKLHIPNFHPIPVPKPAAAKEDSRAIQAWDKAAPWVMAIVSLAIFWLACFGG